LVAVALTFVVVGCGGSGGPAAGEKACERMSGPGAEGTTLTEERMIRAAGKPDKVEATSIKDVYGNPIPPERWTWNDGRGTRIMFDHDHVAIAAICDLSAVPR
jgi:hypothetical protein